MAHKSSSQARLEDRHPGIHTRSLSSALRRAKLQENTQTFTLDSPVDDFIVDSITAYVSKIRRSDTHANIPAHRHKLFDYLLSMMHDSIKYNNFLSYRGERAQSIIDSIQSLLDDDFLEQQIANVFAMALSSLARKSWLCPTRFILSDVRRESSLSAGLLGHTERGIFAGKVVSIKMPRSDSQSHSFYRALLRQVVPWIQLRHENVLPFYGICRLKSGGAALVYPFLNNGNVVDYLQRTPNASRRSFISDVAKGLSYLHDNGIIHGDLKGTNVLISNDFPPRACLADFNLASFLDIYGEAGANLPSSKGTVTPFDAPELYFPIRTYKTKASDVYAFAITCYEIFTGGIPLLPQNPFSGIFESGENRRPSRPASYIHREQGLNDSMWQLMEDSWTHAPHKRPVAREIVDRLSNNEAEERKGEATRTIELREKVTRLLGNVLNTEAYYKRLLSYHGSDCQRVLDAFQLLLDTECLENRRELITAMWRLSQKAGSFPRRFLLHGPAPRLEDEPVASGSYADIYKMYLQGETTCFKVMRAHDRPLVEHMTKVYGTGAVVWGQLSHPNILPFYGLLTYRTRISLISPWAEHGDLSRYLSQNPGANRILLCLDTASGLAYLHANGVVHGDLKAVNVLVDNAGRASLSDFGLSSVRDPEIVAWAAEFSATAKGGTARWQAPELHEPESNFNNNPDSKASDVFAWANICYEIFTGRLPYFETSRESAVALRIIRGGTPTRPGNDDAAWLKNGLNDRVWSMLERCWKFEPSERPDMNTALSSIALEKPIDPRPPGEWERRAPSLFRNAQDTDLQIKIISSLEDLDSVLTQVIQGSGEAGEVSYSYTTS